MRHTQDSTTNVVTVTMSTEEWLTFNHVRREIDLLYSQYFSQGKTPGILEAGGLWNHIMQAWREFRRAQGMV